MLDGRAIEPDRARGVGGIVSLQRAILKTIGIADYLSLDPPVHLATDPAAGFDDTYTNASIGIHTLRSFVLILEYTHHRAAVVSKETWAVHAKPGR